ncbi:MAG: hypothetical protein AAF126_03075 [Chloroflexota bacterium]
MAFNYVGDGSTDLDKIRFHIQDTVENDGAKPKSANFTDEEIGWLLSANGTVANTVGVLFDTLASAWSRYADTQVGSRRESLGKIASDYRDRAKQWRTENNLGSGTTISVVNFDEDLSQNDTSLSSS